jgi:hypothetical protein
VARNRRKEPSEERPSDIDIGATVRAKRLRFGRRPHADVRFRGAALAESHTGSERESLPEEIEPDVTYRDVRIGWRAAAWVDEPPEK